MLNLHFLSFFLSIKFYIQKFYFFFKYFKHSQQSHNNNIILILFLKKESLMRPLLPLLGQSNLFFYLTLLHKNWYFSIEMYDKQSKINSFNLDILL